MADEVRCHLKIGKQAGLRFPFLNAIFAKMPRTGSVCLAERLRLKSLGYGDEGNILHAASGSRGCRRNALVHPFQVCRYRSYVRRHSGDFSTGK